MIRPSICIINCETQEEIIREMTDEEYEQFLKDQEAAQLRNNEENL